MTFFSVKVQKQVEQEVQYRILVNVFKFSLKHLYENM